MRSFSLRCIVFQRQNLSLSVFGDILAPPHSPHIPPPTKRIKGGLEEAISTLFLPQPENSGVEKNGTLSGNFFSLLSRRGVPMEDTARERG
ncbi:hypothetical protein TNCT_305661 [Trichonephila clavata]|uniref:Uncharacterized protein n=1 Tax=Trichonephila clavata TaxID=2740835 RepID=A0A8X6LX91_TRICU|nr:hypothetical protein TNCT_305661 [Trichonephila clavata]